MIARISLVLTLAFVALPSGTEGEWPFSPGHIWPFQQSRFPSNPWAPPSAWASSWKNVMNPMGDSDESIEQEGDAEILPDAIGGPLGGSGGTGWIDFSPTFFQPHFPSGFADLFGGGKPNRRVPWWKGPNVCVDKEEVDDEVPERKDNNGKAETMVVMSKGAGGISISTTGEESGTEDFQLFSVCEQTELQYVCTRKIRKNGIRKTYTEKYHCCHGFERSHDQPGCVKGKREEEKEKPSDSDKEIIP